MNADDSDRWLEEALAAPTLRTDHGDFAKRVLDALPPRRQPPRVRRFIVAAAAALAVTLGLVVLPGGRAALAALSQVLAPLAAVSGGLDSVAAAVAQLGLGALIAGLATLSLGAGLAVAAARSE